MNKKFKKGSLCIIILAFSLVSLYSQEVYWENPRPLTSLDARYYDIQSNGRRTVLVFQEMLSRGDEGGSLFLSVWNTEDMKHWEEHNRVLGPFEYTEKETRIYSFIYTDEDEIYIVLSGGERSALLFRSRDGGTSFDSVRIEAGVTIVSPGISRMENGDLLLFVTYDDEITSHADIYYTVFRDDPFSGEKITPVFTRFVTEPNLDINFLPSHLSFGGREYVVFQAYFRGISVFQIFLKISEDRGRTWSPAVYLSDIEVDGLEATSFVNQRPRLYNLDGQLYFSWEREQTGVLTQCFLGRIDNLGNLLDYERLTITDSRAVFPILFLYNRSPAALWFDNRRGEDHIFLATQQGNQWGAENDLSYNIPGESRFGRPVLFDEILYVFWENESNGKSTLYMLEPDRSVLPSVIRPGNFRAGGRNSLSKVNLSWSMPQDSSGIKGFRYAWTRDPSPEEGAFTEVSRGTTSGRFQADEDGRWYFHLQTGDYAGNWSETRSVFYIRDTTPPEEVLFRDMSLERGGFLPDNNLQIEWDPPEDEDVAGYAISFQWLSANPEEDLSSFNWDRIILPGNRIQQQNNYKAYYNQDNGLYAFTVRAIDEVGNGGPASSILLRLNKYIPSTQLYSLYSRIDEEGANIIRLNGKDFTADGQVTEIYLDRDSRKPYDYTFKLENGDFSFLSNRVIDNLKIIDVEEGTYRVGLYHEKRGLAFFSNTIQLEPYGKVKFGRYTDLEQWRQELIPREEPLFRISYNQVILWLLLALLVAGFFGVIGKLRAIVQEGQLIQTQVETVLYGRSLKEKKEDMMKQLKYKGLGLRFKFTALISILVIIILLIVSIPLSFYMLETQRNDLTEGLKNETIVLISSMGYSAETNLFLGNSLELGLLLDIMQAMQDAGSATITSISSIEKSDIPTRNEFVWATNKKEILDKIQEEGVVMGEYILEDEVSSLVPRIAEKINNKANDELSILIQDITALTERFRQAQGPNQAAIREEVQVALKEKNELITKVLTTLSGNIESIPPYDPANLQDEYIFYKPLVFRRTGEDIYFRGMVRLVVSTTRIRETIAHSAQDLVRRIIIISIIALGLGILGAIILASITIQPIKRVVAGVVKIRDTVDKSELKDHMIRIRQKDEIRMLADTINQMTKGLVKAAIANKELIVGKEVQKMFIPLQKGPSGRLESIGEEITEDIHLFGYYEGAKGVSGDYFDFKKLDNKHYAVIKCDVAGKGVPAALIMVEVATIFIDHFRTWNPSKPDLNLEPLLYRMNDLIEERGFKGRFAAFILGVINVKSGVGVFCNAGDNLVHIYKAAEKKMTMTKIPEAPASGVFPSMLLEMQSGFKQVKLKLNPGDTLVLYTDGIEEAKRMFRDKNFKIIKCEEPGLKEGDLHGGTHPVGNEDEEFGNPRIYEIVGAVFNSRMYELKKFHSPDPDEKLTFDFTRCEGTVREAVMAMVAIEKVFRIYRDPSATKENRVAVDVKIDRFLQDCFVQYSDYFVYREEYIENDPYVYYTHMKEDEQYDDLTVLAIRKK